MVGGKLCWAEGTIDGLGLCLWAAYCTGAGKCSLESVTKDSRNLLNNEIESVDKIQAELCDNDPKFVLSSPNEVEMASKWLSCDSGSCLASLGEHLASRSFLVKDNTPCYTDFRVLALIFLKCPKDTDVISSVPCKQWMGRLRASPQVRDVIKRENCTLPAETKKKQIETKSPKQVDLRPLDDFHRLDVRVGQIITAWPHPDADKLYCEEVDMGNGNIRHIASGLRSYVPIEEMNGARVLVLANMKAKPLRGFASHGMLLCASNSDHTAVELMHPPESAKLGDRIILLSESVSPADEVLSTKKDQDPLVVIMPELKTNSNCEAMYKDKFLGIENCPCRCKSLANARIS